MNRQHLQQTACQLRQPPPSAAAEFEAIRYSLAEELSRRMAARPDLERLIGSGNLPMMQDNSRNFCRFMSSLFQAYEPEVLVDTALWVFRAYRAHGFHTTYWPANLSTFVEILRERLAPATCQTIEPFLDWLIVNIPTFVKLSDEALAIAPPSAGNHPSHGPPT
jgi:hypothetical protein